MTDRLIRLMRIITLVQAKPGILARELAERCETTERTIYRDMEALSAMHIPIANMGHGRGYRFISHFAMYPLNWSDEEAQAFVHLAEVMDDIRPLLKPAFESAYEKVVASNQKNKTERVEWSEQISGLFQIGMSAWQNDKEQRDNSLVTLLQAGISQNTIEAEHLSQGTKKIVRLDPYGLIPREYRFDLLAYCHFSERLQIYEVGNLQKVRILPRTFRKDDFLLQSHLRTMGASQGQERIAFKIRFSRDAVEHVMKQRFLVRPILTMEPEGTLLLETILSDDHEFMGWLAQYGPEAEILEPEAYRIMMKERLERWQQIYR
ncbi:helix-turn-helix transcriptional regulator [Paenibacillus xylanilyticus]|uniref:WYL domain-containing protein n=1 Tax=Paenibacillus xylanilyticus TaxID=248903 RepID=A0A7Y6C0S2_9BACL|nr:WYL domain-containing protein [Paenibacillus xylanilyticus]NUU78508.1 WYL domain-containing protein [Paenibacillus xylanilyticus]